MIEGTVDGRCTAKQRSKEKRSVLCAFNAVLSIDARLLEYSKKVGHGSGGGEQLSWSGGARRTGTRGSGGYVGVYKESLRSCER
ncbi:hypothetical protein WN55_06410 [Dufourea novaeangliae]|uniref:Uncharacterized protein n=1 Tax=Dufourea novaeangliae TaxID=178035 RepID=A0A154P2T8_DUFNO|nr:hypothetical protein WN55_06410 [Dufourea novaeangliae]